MAISFEDLQAIARPDSVAQAAAKKQSAADIGDRFLKLLVTQMRNQDPLNPLENAEVTSQLAQISTVTGVDKLNATMDALSQAITSTQTLQATSMVGRGVLVPGRKLELDASGAIGAVDLKEAAAFVNIAIKDASGLTVRDMLLEDLPAGISTFKWDGKNNDKTDLAHDKPYTFEIKAHSNGRLVEAARLARSEVQSVSLGAGEMQINTRTFGQVPMGDVKQIF